MIKDIDREEVTDVAVAVVKGENENQEPVWDVYLLNLKKERIYGILVTSKGYGNINNEAKKTSILRQFFDELPAESFVKIEPIMEDLFALNNEFWVSFYLDAKIYDKKYIFLPDAILEDNFTQVPLIDKPGVMIR